jgi:hypothetical protein
MKKTIVIAMLTVLAVSAFATDYVSSLTMRQARDPVQMRAILSDNFTLLGAGGGTNGTSLYGILRTNVYTKTETAAAFAPLSTVTNVYTKTETAAAFAPLSTVTNVYTKTETAAAFAPLSTVTNVYTKTESGSTFAPIAVMVTITNIPAASITAGNMGIDRLTNAFTTATGTTITNTSIAADGKTNTYIFMPIGGTYVLKSITTSP